MEVREIMAIFSLAPNTDAQIFTCLVREHGGFLIYSICVYSFAVSCLSVIMKDKIVFQRLRLLQEIAM